MKSDFQKYYIIFDTNVLYHSYDKKGDFSSFSFNGTYDNIVGYVNQLDIYEYVVIVIPNVVWNEMEKQEIEAHDTKLKNFRETISKYNFPEIKINSIRDMDYPKYIHSVIKKYKKDLSLGINNIIDLPLADNSRYQSIVQRAFNKLPPFGGKDNNSDKGFKDALLWESILQFVFQHDNSNIIFYTKDNIFNESLFNEFKDTFPHANLAICSNEEMIKDVLQNWAKDIDIYSYSPIESMDDTSIIESWIESDDFQNQLNENDFELVEKSNLICKTSYILNNYSDINICRQPDGELFYDFDAVLNVVHTLINGTTIKETLDVNITIINLWDDLYIIDDIYKLDADTQYDECKYEKQ